MVSPHTSHSYTPHTDHTVGEEFAALLVQRIWRGYIRKRRMIMTLFHGTRKVLKAGLRVIPDPGPDLLRRNTSNFELDLPPPPVGYITI